MRKMDWRQLMSTQRFRGGLWDPDKDTIPDVRRPFVKDADRIIYSSAFRRLQDKTQVHPFPETDYSRTRLTHSLEVTSVGRSLGMAVGRYVIKKYELNKGGNEKNFDQKKVGSKKSSTEENDDNKKIDLSDFGAVVAAACLAHDIGNPPFGHAGEEAIRHWFTDGAGKELLSDSQQMTDEEKADLTYFEGNAQGFRVLTRLQGWRESGGLQLSCGTLATFMKYPHGSCIAEAETSMRVPRKKFGYFQHDRESFEKICDTVGLLKDEII